MIARAYPPLRDKPVNSTYLPVRTAAIRRVKPRNARLEPDGRPVDQKNTVTMPNAISVTAPSITNCSSITSPGGEGDMVAFTARAHPASPIHNPHFAAPVLDAGETGGSSSFTSRTLSGRWQCAQPGIVAPGDDDRCNTSCDGIRASEVGEPSTYRIRCAQICRQPNGSRGCH
jgi:hypothetical protein